MSKALEASRPKKPTLQRLSVEVTRLRERVEDLEDLRDLHEAIQRNRGKPLIPFSKAKKQLKID